MDLELKGRVAVVTGGSRGIGRVVAEELALEGADVAICARTRDTLEATASELARSTGRRVVPIVADTSDTPSVDAMVATVIETFGRLDILVNNAGQPGGLAHGPLATVTDEAMQTDLNTKFIGYLRCARAAAPHMVKGGYGRIINVAGQSARMPGTYSTGTRNIAIAHMTKTLADELGPSGVNVTCLHPGATLTEYIQEQIETRARNEGKSVSDVEKEMASINAIKRIVTGREVAHVIAFLASPKSASISGEVIGVGGGSGRTIPS